MQHGEDDVDTWIGAWIGRDRTRLPVAVLADENAQDLVALRVHGGDNGLRRAQRDFVFATAASVEHGYTELAHKILFPSALVANSTANCPVRLAWSSTGFTSTISSEVMRPLSQISSMAVCASRYVMPPR